jgi:hypothetical protein
VCTYDGQIGFGQCHLITYFFRFFETFCEHATRNKLCGSTNFIFFGPTNQKLWGNENFKRTLGWASKYWSQPARIDHMFQKLWEEDKFWQGRTLGHLCKAGKRPLVVDLRLGNLGQPTTNSCFLAAARNLINYMLVPYHPSFSNFFTFRGGV